MRLAMKCSYILCCAIILLLYNTDKTVQSASNNVLKLEKGDRYVYKLDGHTETSLPKSKGPHGESVKLNLKGKVEVSINQKGEALIKLKGLQVVGPDGKKHGNLDKLEQHPLLVKINGGRLDSDIRVHPEDDYTSVNIKRSVASLLQINSDDSGYVDEVDVFGGCPTNYRVNKEGDVTVVTKTRNLNRCRYREELRQDLFAVSHAHSSDFQTSPLLDSDFESEQRIKGGVLESALVKENYLFKPFTNRDNGARTKVTTKLTLESKAKGDAPALAKSESRSIIFENPHEIVTSNRQTVLAALHKAVNNVADAVTTTAARDFGALVHVVRHASKNDLLSIYGDAKAGAGFKNKQAAKKVFTDALFRAKSADSVAVAVELLKNHEIEGNLARLWYLSFGFVRHSSASALAAAASLLDDATLPREAYLGVGALAGQYCREHSCESVPELDQLLSKLAGIIENPAQVTKEKENKIVAALKGLKNVKRLNDETAAKVAQVIKESKAPVRVRVAALETAQSDACRGKVQKAAADILNNREEDSELRIRAYLVLAECPNAKTANKLSEFLESEPINQVGSFITSHLRNLRASSNPDREAAREVLQNVKPKKKYPIDERKFSHNHEASFNVDALSTSAALESNVIFSQKSYLPRSVNLNVTTEVFGHAFNLFEVSARAENLERVIERYLGPKGYMRTHKPEEIIKEASEQLNSIRSNIDEKYKNLVRNRRSVTRDQTNKFSNKVQLYNNVQDSNIDIDLSLKLLGNELIWVNVDDSKAPVTASSVIDQIAAALERGFGSVKDFSHDLKNNLHFLDSELSYPTSTGFPLRLSATGSSVAHLKLGGNLDLKNLLKDPKNGQAKFKLIPSASVEVVGEFTIDAYAVEAGLKVAANLHTATGSEVTIQLLDGHGVDVNLGLPVTQSDILTVNTEVLAVVKERGQSSVDSVLEFQVQRKDFSGCFDQLQSFIGLTFCGEVGFPLDQQPLITNAALFPLNGHSKVSLRLNKEDESLKSYHLRFYFNIEDPKNRRVEIKIDTPGSKVPRELSFLASAVTEPQKAVTVQFVSPLHKFSVQGQITDTDSEYSVSGSVNLDDAAVYKARLGVLISGTTYTPVLEYTPVGGSQIDVKVSGTVNVEKKAGTGYRKYTFNSVKLTAPKSVYSIDGTVIRDVNLFQTDLKLGYDQQTVGLKTKIQRQGDKNLKVNAEVQPSQYPEFGFSIKYEYQRDESHVENSFVLIHGADLSSKVQKLSLFQQTHYKVESPGFDVSTKNKIAYPLLEIEGRLDGAATRKSLSYDLELSHAKNKIKSRLSAKTGITKPGDYEIDFQASVLEHEVKIEAKRDIVDTDKSKFTNKLQLQPGGKYEVSADVTHQLRPNDVNARVVAVVKIHDLPNNYNLDVGVVTNPSLFDGHTKVSVGADEYLNAALKFTRAPPPSGNFKLNIRKVVESQGEYKLAGGKGSGAVNINLVGLGRKIKGSADITVAGSKHTGVIEILYDAGRDPNKKLLIETDTDLTKSSIKSKNKLKLVDKELLVNFNGETQGKTTNGATNGGFDVTLPTGRYIVGMLKESLRIVPGVSNAELFIELGMADKQGAPLKKIFMDTYAKNVDFKRYSADTKFELGHECPEGSLKYTQTINASPKDGKVVLDLQNSLTGSVVTGKYEGKAHLVLSRPEITFDTSLVAQEYNFNSKGKVLTGVVDNVRHLEYATEVNTPLDIVKNLKINHVFHLEQGDESKPHQLKVSQDYVLNEKKLSLSGEGEFQRKAGHVKLSALLPGNASPCTAEIKYKHDGEGDVHKSELSVVTNSHDGKNSNVNVKAEYDRNLNSINAHIVAQTPLNALKTIDLQLGHKKLSSVARNTDVKLVLNGEKIDGFFKLDLTPNHPVVDLTLVHSAGKTRFYYKLDKKNDRQASSEGQIAWTRNGGGQYDFSTNVDIESVDSFLITIKINSEKLKLNKLKLEIGNRQSKGGAAKIINFTAQDADKKGFSGSVSYNFVEKDGGFTIDGKGNINIHNEKHPLTYKAIFKQLSKANDKENGRSFTITADYGKGKFDLEYKLSDKELHYNAKYCKEGACNNFEVLSRIQFLDYLEFKHDALLNYENKLDGKNELVKVYSKTHRKGLIVARHETGLTVKDRKYLLKSYLEESEAGVVIELPTREIDAIVKYELPLLSGSKSKGGPNTIQYKFDGSLYLDKKKSPNDRANLIVLGDITTIQKAISVNGEARFSHPSLQKELLVKTKGTLGLEKRLVDASVEVDVFNKRNQRIVASVKVDHERTANGHNVTGKLDFSSKGLVLDVGASGHVYSSKDSFSAASFLYYVDDKNIKKDAGAFIEANPSKFFAVVKVPNKELLKINAKVQTAGDEKQGEAEVSLAELRTIVGKTSIVPLRSIKASLYRKDNPNQKLEGTIGFAGKQLEVRAEKVDGGNKVNLFFVVLKLDETKAITPNYELNTEELKKVIQHLTSESNNLVNQIKTLLNELSKEIARELTALLESLKKAQPNLKPLLQQYQAQFDAIRKELSEDPEFKKLAEAVKNVLGSFLESLEEKIKVLVQFYERAAKELADVQEKLLASYKKILPQLLQAFEKVLNSLSVLLVRLTEYASQVLSQVLELIRQNEADIRLLVTNFSESFQDFSRIFVSTTTQLRHEVEQFIKVAIDQIKSLPIYSIVQEQYNELWNMELPPQFWNLYSEFTFAIQDFLPTKELKEFVKSIFDYIEKRLKRQDVNDLAALRGISELAVKAFKSLAELIKQQYTSDDAFSLFGLDLKFPLPGATLFRLPQTFSLKDCAFVRFFKIFGELPSIADYYYTYRPTLNPLDYVPPFKAYAQILNSHHFFTFDRRHFAFKGTCSYVLAQDFQDGNFSIIANLDNGKLRSITVNDQTDSVDILNDNTVVVNGKAGDYPFNQNDLSGWRRYGSVNLKHKAGVFITKYLNKDIYLIRVSGFYFGRTRGLLGTINNEQHDEFTLPNGHLAKDVSEFVNAYKVVDSCANVAEIKHGESHAPECNQFFTSDSSFRNGFYYVNPDIYREACDQHVTMGAADKLKAACEVVNTYVLALKQEHVPFAAMPSECVKCTINGKPLELGYSDTAQSPKGKADVVLVIEQSSHNSPVFKELVTPLITTLSQDLKEKGLGDVEFAVIGFGGPNQKWPAHYGNNGKHTYEGKADSIVFGDSERLTPPYDTLGKKIKYVINFLKIELGEEQIVYAMDEANAYPFRQGAAKIVILVNSLPCSKSPIFPVSLQVPRILGIRKFYKEHGLNFHIISPLAGLTVSNKPDQKLKNVVGFDSNKIYTLNDAKKKQLEGDATDRPNLKYEEDLCLAFSQYYGGAAFSSQNFVEAKAEQKKKFVHVVSQRIVQGATAYEFTEDCTCNLYQGVFSHPECKVSHQEQKGR